jgi:hypothetical protein
MLYRGGMRTPNGQQIEDITAQLSRYGKIEGKNVFYWFQNHKARERQKQKRNSLGLSHSPRTPSPVTIISLDTRVCLSSHKDLILNLFTLINEALNVLLSLYLILLFLYRERWRERRIVYTKESVGAGPLSAWN